MPSHPFRAPSALARRPAPVRSFRSLPRLLLALLAILALVAACGVALPRVTATETVERTLDVTPGTAVAVDTFNGAIEVVAGSAGVVRATVEVTGSGSTRADAEADRDTIVVTIDQDGDRIAVRAEDTRPGPTLGEHGAQVRLTVPGGTPLDLRTSNGPVTVRDTDATATVRTSNGPVDLAGVTGAVSVDTSNGPVELTADDVLADVRTSNGPITFVGSIGPGTHRFTTSNGPIVLRLPASAAFTIDGATSNGHVRSDFALAGTLDDSSVQGRVGETDGVAIVARTSNGDLTLATR